MESWLERAAALRPRGLAVESGEGALTYAELLSRARGVGVRRGERVAILLAPGLEFAVALHACLLAGAVAMPIDPRLGERERALQLAGASVVIGGALDGPGGTAGIEGEALSGRLGGMGGTAGIEGAVISGRLGRAGLDEVAGAVGLGDVALVVHTSGTTGAPRPVALTYGNVLANALGCAVALGHDRGERWLCPLPLSHVGGLMVLLRSVVAGTTAVLDAADRDDVTIASLVPTQLGRLLEAGVAPGPRLRVVMLGGAPADPTLLARAAAAGWPVAPTYGLTQTCSAVTVAEPGDTETSGTPLPGVDVTIAPDGEILVAGPTVAGGGVLHTGDLGRLDGGRLVVVGRKSDTIVTGGENVAPTEVEAVLLEHPAVAEAGVAGRPDAEWGEAVTAFVVLRGEVSPEELRAFCAARLARFKVPKAIEPVAALPRTASGKLLRRELN
jgi:O-succinylbenzoic acid--CoA ligase